MGRSAASVTSAGPGVLRGAPALKSVARGTAGGGAAAPGRGRREATPAVVPITTRPSKDNRRAALRAEWGALAAETRARATGPALTERSPAKRDRLVAKAVRRVRRGGAD